jgi:hypothetical protein
MSTNGRLSRLPTSSHPCPDVKTDAPPRKSKCFRLPTPWTILKAWMAGAVVLTALTQGKHLFAPTQPILPGSLGLQPLQPSVGSLSASPSNFVWTPPQLHLQGSLPLGIDPSSWYEEYSSTRTQEASSDPSIPNSESNSSEPEDSEPSSSVSNPAPRESGISEPEGGVPSLSAPHSASTEESNSSKPEASERSSSVALSIPTKSSSSEPNDSEPSSSRPNSSSTTFPGPSHCEDNVFSRQSDSIPVLLGVVAGVGLTLGGQTIHKRCKKENASPAASTPTNTSQEADLELGIQDSKLFLTHCGGSKADGQIKDYKSDTSDNPVVRDLNDAKVKPIWDANKGCFSRVPTFGSFVWTILPDALSVFQTSCLTLAVGVSAFNLSGFYAVSGRLGFHQRSTINGSVSLFDTNGTESIYPLQNQTLSSQNKVLIPIGKLLQHFLHRWEHPAVLGLAWTGGVGLLLIRDNVLDYCKTVSDGYLRLAAERDMAARQPAEEEILSLKNTKWLERVGRLTSVGGQIIFGLSSYVMLMRTVMEAGAGGRPIEINPDVQSLSNILRVENSQNVTSVFNGTVGDAYNQNHGAFPSAPDANQSRQVVQGNITYLHNCSGILQFNNTITSNIRSYIGLLRGEGSEEEGIMLPTFMGLGLLGIAGGLILKNKVAAREAYNQRAEEHNQIVRRKRKQKDSMTPPPPSSASSSQSVPLTILQQT